MGKSISISGTGCCLVDQIYPDIDFSSPVAAKYLSQEKSDGGLHPGRLVFSEQFENFANKSLGNVINEITQDKAKPTFNVGGPSIVALIHAAQLLQGKDHKVKFYGLRGNDKTGEYLQSKLEQTPVVLDQLKISKGSTPSTIVLSDPDFHSGHGERIFINEIGAAWNFGTEELPDAFFESDILVFGGTALVPGLHHGLTQLLIRAKEKGALTVVNTVYDFQSELQNPGKHWSLGDSLDSYRYIDLLIMDREEAQHLSGHEDLTEALNYFKEKDVSASIITNGTEDTLCISEGELFKPTKRTNFPVSKALVEALHDHNGGDTTGCGDNFVGGALASIAWQMSEGRTRLDLEECIAWGTVSGGHACFHVGGTLIEKARGEKLSHIQPYYKLYLSQLQNEQSIVIFGAGKIGRSFIGQLFGNAGYKVVFVDMDQTLIKALNKRGSYPVIIKGPHAEEQVTINKVSAIHATNIQSVLEAICEAEIMAISVGKTALAKVAEVLALGLWEREQRSPGRILDIILAENMRSANEFLFGKLREKLPDSYPLDKRVGLVETSIGKMVPIMTTKDLEEDPVQVFAEPYNTLILDKKGFKGEIPPIMEFALKENMKAWVDRKAFIHNLGHATAAYAGYLKDPTTTFIYEALADNKILDFTRSVMEQSAQILRKAYPGEFTQDDLCEHIEDLLQRFQNKKLGDTIFRVGCDLHRKLGKDDRFMGAIRLAQELDLPSDLILEAMSMGFLFQGKDEFGKMLPEDLEFHQKWVNKPDDVLDQVCGLRKNEEVKSIKDKISRLKLSD